MNVSVEADADREMEAQVEQPRPRWWLVAGFALVALKLAITGLWIAERHHIASLPSHAVDETLWWIAKITPPLFVAAFAMDAHQIGNRIYARFFFVLFFIAVVYGTVVTYAILHGWNGTPI